MAITRLNNNSVTSVSALPNLASLPSAVAVSGTPAFLAYPSGDNGINDNSYSILQANTELYDTDSAYNTSTYTFTVPSGKGGKYLFYWNSQNEHGNLVRESLSVLYVNGSQYSRGTNYLYTGTTDRAGDHSANNTIVLDLSAGDYVSVYSYLNSGANNAGLIVGSRSYFGGHKLIQ